ncbi:hypothetical protein CEUSTIGMA_g4493.t1, partial [Chlamydomonas eustigma]
PSPPSPPPPSPTPPSPVSPSPLPPSPPLPSPQPPEPSPPFPSPFPNPPPSPHPLSPSNPPLFPASSSPLVYTPLFFPLPPGPVASITNPPGFPSPPQAPVQVPAGFPWGSCNNNGPVGYTLTFLGFSPGSSTAFTTLGFNIVVLNTSKLPNFKLAIIVFPIPFNVVNEIQNAIFNGASVQLGFQTFSQGTIFYITGFPSVPPASVVQGSGELGAGLNFSFEVPTYLASLNMLLSQPVYSVYSLNGQTCPVGVLVVD